MTRSTSNSNSSSRRPSVFTQQPWEMIKWFWRFSKFYGNYIPGDLSQKHRPTQAHP